MKKFEKLLESVTQEMEGYPETKRFQKKGSQTMSSAFSTRREINLCESARMEGGRIFEKEGDLLELDDDVRKDLTPEEKEILPRAGETDTEWLARAGEGVKDWFSSFYKKDFWPDYKGRLVAKTTYTVSSTKAAGTLGKDPKNKKYAFLIYNALVAALELDAAGEKFIRASELLSKESHELASDRKNAGKFLRA